MTATAAAVLLALLGAPGSVAQTPNLSGTWRATKDAPSTAPAAPTAVFGDQFGLQIAGQQLTVSRIIRGATVPLTMALDGAETRATVPGATCLGDSGVVVKAARDGDAIVYTIVAVLPPGGGAPTPSGLKYTFRLIAADTLVVETTRRANAQSEPQPVGTIYKRSAEPLPVVERPVVEAAPAAIADVAWIAGTWAGGTAPTALEERWTAASGGSMIGTSRTMRSGVMSAFEFLCIVERGGSLVYTAMPNAAPPTHFTLTKIDADSATFENPSHDFPKLIRYAKTSDGGLETSISAGPNQRATTFRYKRQ